MPVILAEIAKDFDEDLYYLDFWPFATPFLIVNDPQVAARATGNKPSLPKPKMYSFMFDNVMGGPNLLSMNGNEWKSWRAIFNPAFAQSYLLDQVPAMVKLTKNFCEILTSFGETSTVFPLEEPALRLTMDTIYQVAMYEMPSALSIYLQIRANLMIRDEGLNYQKGPNTLADSLRNIVDWCSFGNPFALLNPLRPIMIWYHGRRMHRYIYKALQQRFEVLQDRPEGSAAGKKSKSVISLALENYTNERQAKSKRVGKLEPHFAEHAIRQIRVFLFAGHDTTAGILCWTYHELSRHPHVLKRMRDEHETVFSNDPDEAGALLVKDPTLINRLPYTLAVLKEVLRRWPPAGAYREGQSDFSVQDRLGTTYPTGGIDVAMQHYALHHNPRYWARPEEFLPERWLESDPNAELYPPANCFRPFEQGSRTCIGQNLALLELRVVLVMTVRKFEITAAYEEWDKYRGRVWKATDIKDIDG